jgi:ATP-dependent exoDNAse (exonuclease V) beta subunit
VAAFVSWLDLATRTDARGERGVDLVTFHRAKGLEWQVVFVTGLERGLVPISWATTPAARAEERRLLHVALGRAEDTLHCSWARLRTAGGRRSARQPSPWLGDLELAIAGVPVAAVDQRARIGDALAALHDTTPPPRDEPRPSGHALRRKVSLPRACTDTTRAPNASPTSCSRTRASGSRSSRCRSTTASTRRARRAAPQPHRRGRKRPGTVLALYSEVLAPAVISCDSPRFLAFIPPRPRRPRCCST